MWSVSRRPTIRSKFDDVEDASQGPPTPRLTRRRPAGWPWLNLSRQTVHFLVTALVSFTAGAVAVRLYLNVSSGLPLVSRHSLKHHGILPPLYGRYHESEVRLAERTQNAEGQGKYLWIANHVRALGWGNALQESLLNHYLAYRAGRSFVFSNYTWSDSRAQYTYYDGKPIPSRIPLSVLIDGPTVGMPFVSDPHAPTAIVKEYWDKICPHPRVIRNDDVVAPLGQEPTAEALIERWTEVLQGTADPCVEVSQDSAAIFDYLLFGDPKRLLDAWPAFSQSPVLREFRWSPLIELAFDVNRETVSPSRALAPFMSRMPDAHSTMAERYSVLPGLLALHIRRGDYSHHCKHLVKHSSTYTGYSSFPGLPDKFVPPNGDYRTREKEYWRHCLPDIEQIVRRVAEVRRTPAGQSLRSVYVMTNGPAEWVEQLKDALYGMGRWTSVASSRDLVVNAEQQYVKQAVDMLIGQRAQVFIGNGFSSLTGQVVMLRMASGIDPETNRFW